MNSLSSAALARPTTRAFARTGLQAFGRVVSLAGAVSLALVFPGTARAQAPDPPAGFLQVTIVKVKPASVSDFEDYVKKVTAAALKVGGRPVGAYQQMYGDPNVYAFVVRMDTGKDLDGQSSVPQTLIKAYGDAEGARLLKAGRATIDSITIERHNTVRSLSTNLGPATKPSKYVQFMRSEIKPEMGGAYRLILQKIKKAEEALPNATPATRRIVSDGATALTVTVARSFNTFAERDAWPNQREAIRKMYGDDEDRLMNETIQRAISARASNVLAYRADLSSSAAGTASGQ